MIHRLSPLGADAGAIVKQLDSESDLTIRRALLLSLGEYGETEITPDAHSALLPKFDPSGPRVPFNVLPAAVT